MKNIEERFESLEKTVRLYRILIVLLFIFIFWTQRENIVGCMNRIDSWFSAVGNTRV